MSLWSQGNDYGSREYTILVLLPWKIETVHEEKWVKAKLERESMIRWPKIKMAWRKFSIRGWVEWSFQVKSEEKLVPVKRLSWSVFCLFVELDFRHNSLSNICSNVGCYFGCHCRCWHCCCILLSLRSQGVEEFVAAQGFSLILHQHLHASLVMRGQISNSSKYCAGHVFHSWDLYPLKLSHTKSQFGQFFTQKKYQEETHYQSHS